MKGFYGRFEWHCPSRRGAMTIKDAPRITRGTVVSRSLLVRFMVLSCSIDMDLSQARREGIAAMNRSLRGVSKVTRMGFAK